MVCERWYVTMWRVKDSVKDSKMVCEKECVIKLCVTKWCVKDGVAKDDV